MNVVITPAPLSGQVRAIASKSYAHRLLICAALSSSPSRILCGEMSEDILATAGCLNAMGADIRKIDGGFAVIPIKQAVRNAVIDCGESGSTLRFLLPVICALGSGAEIHMHGRLPQRPLSPLYEELAAHGAVLSGQGSSPLCVSGKISGGEYSLPGNISSQFISGLMFALPLIGGGKVNITSSIESGSYLDITAECLKKFGIAFTNQVNIISVSGHYCAPDKLAVEGDWSNAAFWLGAGALGAKPVTVSGLNMSSAQGDRGIVDVLSRLGAAVVCGENSVTVSPSELRGCDIDAADIPDLVPVISVLCAAAAGESRIYNAARLRIKESDRLKSVTVMLSALGASISETPDGLIIRGGQALHGGAVDSFGDHRIAMSAAIAASICSGCVTITGADAVRKSYPEFFGDYSALGGTVNEQI